MNIKKSIERFTSKTETNNSIALSDVGNKRKINEDNLLIDEKNGLYIVADGLGGHKSGEVASQLAVEKINSYISQFSDNIIPSPGAIKKVLYDAIEDANTQINNQNIAQGYTDGQGMGTTITGFWLPPSAQKEEQKMYAFNVGDSRCYSFYQQVLTQLSTDHSHYQLWEEIGRVKDAPTKNIIYKAIGPWKKVVADQYTHIIRENELILLCSDGLSDMLADDEICAILNDNESQSLRQIAQELVSMANKSGGKDNVTVLLFKPYSKKSVRINF